MPRLLRAQGTIKLDVDVTLSAAYTFSGGDDPPGEDPPAGTGSIWGVITDASGGSVTVDANPSDGLLRDGSEAALVLGENTEVLLWQGGETAAASVEDLRAGQTVEAAYAVPEGPQPAICPRGYEAIRSPATSSRRTTRQESQLEDALPGADTSVGGLTGI